MTPLITTMYICVFFFRNLYGILMERNGHALPIEIKSGKDYTKHAALSNVLANEDYDIPEAYVFENDDVSQAGKITYDPVDMLMFVEKQAQGGDLIDTIDLGPLQSNDDRS